MPTNLIQLIAPHIDRREAVAEAVLANALESKRNLKAFARAAGLDGRLKLANIVARQVWSEDREARHDIVLESSTKIPIRIELKGDAPFTPRQTKALCDGRCKQDSRIEVLVVPEFRKPKDSRANVVTWEQLDDVLDLGGVKLADLWLGKTVWMAEELKKAMRGFVACRLGSGDEGADWTLLWKPLVYLRQALGDIIRDCERITPGSDGEVICWYGMTVTDRRKRDFWIGWSFARGPGKSIRAALMLFDHEDHLPRRFRRLLPSWSMDDDGEDRGVTLWDNVKEDAPAQLDFRRYAEKIREALSARS